VDKVIEEVTQHRSEIIQHWHQNAPRRRSTPLIVAGIFIALGGLVGVLEQNVVLAIFVIACGLIISLSIGLSLWKDERTFRRWIDNPGEANSAAQFMAVQTLYIIQTPKKVRNQHASKLILFVMIPLLIFPVIFGIVALTLRLFFPEPPNLLIIALTFVSWALLIRLWNRVGPRLLN
jgi:hypothetical protein